MLKRSFFYYLILLIVLLKVNTNIIREYRQGYLGSLYDVGFLRSIDNAESSKKNTLAGIVYFDYVRRIDPSNALAWQLLIESYIVAGNKAKARQTLFLALNTIPENSTLYPKLLELSRFLQYP